MADTHLLRQLYLPARYEPLVRRVGPEVAQLLVDPGESTKNAFQQASLAVNTSGQGLFIPAYGLPGTGKTTLARNLTRFLGSEYATSIVHEGPVDREALVESVRAGAPSRSDDRIVPLVIDSRESDPPNDQELAAIKAFQREDTFGYRCVVIWPETDNTLARRMADGYKRIVGSPPIDLPLQVSGPARDRWVQLAIDTIRLANQNIDNLQELGVNPRLYEPDDFETVGAFLNRISTDFSDYVHRLITEMRKPVRLGVVFCSESSDAGVLSQFTTGGPGGLLDGSTLVAATSESRIGRYWGTRAGALIETIVRLDARAYCLPPTASVAGLRRYGSEAAQKLLADAGVATRGPAEVADQIGSTDLGRMLRREPRQAFETRGRPTTVSLDGFRALAEAGFNVGGDKPLNRAMSDSLATVLTRYEVGAVVMPAESAMADSSLIPDNAIDYGDEYNVAIEYTWRAGDYLRSGNRSSVAQYILEKLKNYALDAGWVES